MSLSIEAARRENRKKEARRQKEEAAEKKENEQTGKFFQFTIPPPAKAFFSEERLLATRQSLWKALWSRKKKELYSPLCSVASPQVALQFNTAWNRAIQSVLWDYDKAQNNPALSVCVSKVSCAFKASRPAVFRSPESARTLSPCTSEMLSWVCKATEERTAHEVVSLNAQVPGPVGYGLLQRALAQVFPPGNSNFRAAMALLERYRRLALHAPLSCLINVHGCSPYFLMRWPPLGSRANPQKLKPCKQRVKQVQEHLEKLLLQHKRQLQYEPYFTGPYVVGCKLTKRSPRKGLRLEEPWDCVELHFATKQALSWALSIFEIKRDKEPLWNWDHVWRYGSHERARLESRFVQPAFGKHRVELLNAKVDPEIQFVTDYKTSGNRWTRLPKGKYLLTPCFPEKRWNRDLRREVRERQFLTAFRLDVHASYLQPEAEEKQALPLKVSVFDIEVASRSGRFPSTLRGDHIIQVAVTSYYDCTDDPQLKAFRNRTVFCLGETPSFKASDGQSVQVVDYSIRQVFIFLVFQALQALGHLLVPAAVSSSLCALLDSFLGSNDDPQGSSNVFARLSGILCQLGAALEGIYKGSEISRLKPEVTEALRSRRKNKGRASCVRTPAGEWGSWDWKTCFISYKQCIASQVGASSGHKIPLVLSKVQHQAARFLSTVQFELQSCGASATRFRQSSETYRRAIDLAEAELLQDVVDWFRRADSSVICGHNTDGYDIPEVMRAAFRLDTPSAWVWSNEAKPVEVRDTVFKSAASGALKVTEVEFPGRLVSVDTLKYFKKMDGSTKLSRYNLNTIAAHFLQDQKKADMNYQDLPLYFFKGPQTRLLEAMYCMQDVDLLWMILQKRKPFHELLALMERSGISLNRMMNKGQMYQSNLQLLPICNKAGVATLWCKPKKEATFQGATVVEPNRGYYSDPVVTLDFASLYPSIMSAYNICFTTVVFEPKKNLAAQTKLLVTKVPRTKDESPQEWFLRVFRVACAGTRAKACLEHILASLDEEGVPQSVQLPPVASGDVLQFIIHKKYKKGLLPGIVEELMRLRKITKEEMNRAEGIQKTLLNAKQKAQKLMQNSMYGSASLIWRVVGLLITFYGRHLIEFTTKKAQELGAKWGAHVVYGDTDSVFVKFDTKLLFPPGYDPTEAEVVARAREAGLWLEQELNKLYEVQLGVVRITLECEAVLMNLLLTNKKRYTALMNEVTGSGTRSKGVYTRGMANVRGDQPKFIKAGLELIVKTLIHCGLDQAVVAVQCLASRLLHGEIPLEQCILYKGYKKEFYADPVPGHIRLAWRLGLKVGDQVPFVLVKANSKALQAEKMESPRSLGEDCEISYREYLERYLVPTFSGLLAVPFTQEVNEIGNRFSDSKESAKDIERRKKATQKAIFEKSSCSTCRTPLSLAHGFPLHLHKKEQITALQEFFKSTGQRKKAKKQVTLSSLWSSSGPTVPAPTKTGDYSAEGWTLGKKWFLCKKCVDLIVASKVHQEAEKLLSASLLKRKLIPQLALFRQERTAPPSAPKQSRKRSQTPLHNSRQNTLKRSLTPLSDSQRRSKRQKLEIRYSESDKQTLKELTLSQRAKVEAFKKTCTECRKGTGLDPADCDADSCEQWFSRDSSASFLADLEDVCSCWGVSLSALSDLEDVCSCFLASLEDVCSCRGVSLS